MYPSGLLISRLIAILTLLVSTLEEIGILLEPRSAEAPATVHSILPLTAPSLLVLPVNIINGTDVRRSAVPPSD